MNPAHRSMTPLSRRQLVARMAAAALLPVASLPGRAQSVWPSRPIRIVVPFAAGSSVDIVARVVSDPLARVLGQPVIVDNRAGASGIIGADSAAKSPADGYTLLLSVNSIMCINPHVYQKLPYDAFKDFSAVTQAVRVPYVLIAGPQQPFRTVSDLLEQARRKPGAVDYASLGVGTAAHVVMEMMCNMANVRMNNVPYKGSPLTDLIAGQVAVTLEPVTTAIPMVKSGKVRALAVTSKARLPSLPDVPTTAETLPGFDGDGWQGFYLPAATPKDITKRLNEEIVKALRLPEASTRLGELGLQPVGDSVDEFARVTRSDYDKWGRIVKANNIRIE
ncbi:MAG: tripartite tricarboxylate transporter substrate binding protein [Acidovorax sp.]|uniref:Bug family tripartite tricarboxylate transporter substrate binding protein n=1 Tax=Acidovorax sp. TaxID=1872122 RepID=UPI0039E5CF1A